MRDVIIVGAGPGGMTAGLYAGRAGLDVLMVERGIAGGQMMNTADIENYPGYVSITGPELSVEMNKHVMEFGVDYKYGNVDEVRDKGDYKEVVVNGEVIETKAVIMATGASYRKLGIQGEEEFSGRGVSYCAVCDGAFFKGKEVVVVGGGDSAVEEAVYLTKFADKVTVIHRRDEFRAQKILQDRLDRNPMIDVIWDSVVREVKGERLVEGVEIENVKTGEKDVVATNGVFIYIGLDPLSDSVKGLDILTDEGYIVTNEDMETDVEGIYAIGDIRDKYLRQVVTAAGDGSIAAQKVQEYLEKLEERSSVK